jgi:lipopolysaccharide/colanic/teichoic acid biosynthesis glycosyltransferase
VLYRQTRVGHYSRPFQILKFRTMVVDAERESIMWTLTDDPRATPLGRWLRRYRLDEIPQLLNIIRGDMSFVGPRPERPEITRCLEQELPHYAFRHLVRPGLTGWAQVNYGYGASVEDARVKLEYDLYYVRHASFGTDLAIVLRTLPSFAKGGR